MGELFFRNFTRIYENDDDDDKKSPSVVGSSLYNRWNCHLLKKFNVIIFATLLTLKLSRNGRPFLNKSKDPRGSMAWIPVSELILLLLLFTGIQNTTADGEKGAKGEKGEKGSTTYLEAGTKGISGLKGFKGNKGETGASGDKGNTGISPKGEKGIKGVTGASGDKGNTGISP